MVAKDFPCKTCYHGAEHHYTNISGGPGVCTFCYDRIRNDYGNDHLHEFVGDNLKYMELQKRKQDILNEQA